MDSRWARNVLEQVCSELRDERRRAARLRPIGIGLALGLAVGCGGTDEDHDAGSPCSPYESSCVGGVDAGPDAAEDTSTEPQDTAEDAVPVDTRIDTGRPASLYGVVDDEW